MELKDIQNFLNHHVGEKWFDIDLELYKRIFPQSKIIKELENALAFRKAEFDERMCYEMMHEGAVCDCSIWENRGFTKDKDGFIVPISVADGPSEFEQQLIDLNLDEKQEYNTLKTLMFKLGVLSADGKQETYIEALKAKKIELFKKHSITPPVETGKPENQDKTDNTDKTDTLLAKAETEGGAEVDSIETDKDGNVIVTNEGETITIPADAVITEEKKSESQEQNTQQ